LKATIPKRGPDFVQSPDLLAAALNVLGKADGVSLGKAMRGKDRARLRAEQYRLVMEQKRRSASNPPAQAPEAPPVERKPPLDAGV
jgi:hypothetical protein